MKDTWTNSLSHHSPSGNFFESVFKGQFGLCMPMGRGGGETLSQDSFYQREQEGKKKG